MGKVIMVVLCMVVASLIGCAKNSRVTASDIVGEYAFRYQTGEVEVLILFEDLTYKQEIYPSPVEFRSRGAPVHTNSGSWTFAGRKLTLKSWLLFCDWPNVERVLQTPKKSALLRVSWWPPTRKRHAAILLAENPPHDYMMIRVKSREEVK